jgi:hypothetical protein
VELTPHVANQDAGKAYEAIAPSLEKLIKLNEGIACHVEPAGPNV